MKRSLLLLCTLLGATLAGYSQRTYQVLPDPVDHHAHLFRGMVTLEDLKADTSFHWYRESEQMYPHPLAGLLHALTEYRDSLSFVIFAGTWCEDTHYIIPKFFKALQEAGFPEDHYTIFALDRFKETTGHMARIFHITATPTIVILKNGREIGRLVEYGKTGLWDKELTALIRTGFGGSADQLHGGGD